MKRSGPIKRKTKLSASAKWSPPRTRLKQRRSTGKPTKAESAHMEQVKQPGMCVCCWINAKTLGLARADGEGCDAHHVLIGGRRAGHGDTLGLCPWHHRGVRPSQYVSDAAATRALGPSLAHGSKPFHRAYGDDVFLLLAQDAMHMSSRC